MSPIDKPKVFLILLLSLIAATAGYVYYFGVFPSLPKFSVDQEKPPIIATTTPVATSQPKPIPSYPAKPKDKPYTPSTITPSTKTDFTVIYTDAGFTPQTLQVPAGKSVRFTNGSSGSMLVSSAYNGTQPTYSSLNQGSSVGRGGTYDFTFSERGTYIYFNLNKKTHTGVIAVQ